MPSTAKSPSKRADDVAELSKALKLLSSKQSDDDRANAQRRHVLRRVLNLLTIAVDVSKLFPDVVLNAHTVDVACKKLIYAYICHHARRERELATLAVNALQKDCASANETIRGLAIRSIAGLGVDDLIEYATACVMAGLRDAGGYPRAVAAMGALKVYDLNPSAVRETGILDALREMLVNDTDAGVVGNCLIVLREIDGIESLATKPIVYALINRIKSFSEWNQALILELVGAYEIQNKDETFDIMNALESRLSAPNSAIVLGTVKVFLNITLEMPDVHQQVLERIKAPLFTLANGGTVETSYAVWAHVRLLVKRAPILFSTDYKNFYFRGSDSGAVKSLKLSMLVAVADAQNTYDIVTELTEYVTDADIGIARAAVRAVGEIALSAADDLEGIVDRLLQYFDLDIEHVTAETIISVVNVLRKRPKYAVQCVQAIKNIDLIDVVPSRARGALVWMYGEYGEDIPLAPYFIEPVLTNFGDEPSANVRSQLLSSAMKLFFKRAPEMQAMLGAALLAGSCDTNQEVRDLASLYYRLLERDVRAAEKVVNSRDKSSPIYTFKETVIEDETFDKVFNEFNTLSVLYERPEVKFVDPDAFTRRARVDADEMDDIAAGGGGSLIDHSMDMIDLGDTDEEKASASGGSAVDLLSLLDVDVPAAPQPVDAPPAVFALDPLPALDSTSFQMKWTSAAVVATGLQATLRSNALASAAQVTQHLAPRGVATMASGGPSNAMKFYFYAIDNGNREIFLVEALIDATARAATFTAKCDGRGTNFVAFQRLFAEALSSIP